MGALRARLDKASAVQEVMFNALAERLDTLELGLVATQNAINEDRETINLYGEALTLLDARVSQLEIDSSGVLPN
jgi:hypothetical protein